MTPLFHPACCTREPLCYLCIDVLLDDALSFVLLKKNKKKKRTSMQEFIKLRTQRANRGKKRKKNMRYAKLDHSVKFNGMRQKGLCYIKDHFKQQLPFFSSNKRQTFIIIKFNHRLFFFCFGLRQKEKKVVYLPFFPAIIILDQSLNWMLHILPDKMLPLVCTSHLATQKTW